MEAATVGAILKASLPSLFKLVGDRCKRLEPVVRSIQEKLEIMQSIFQDPSWGGNKTSDFKITQLKRLAEEINDCMASFDAKMISVTQFARKISELKARIESLFVGLQSFSALAPINPCSPPPVTADAEEDLLTLVQNQSEMKAKVICAIGFGGRNTLLARQVYNNAEVRWQFGQWAWVTAADKTMDDVLMEILGQFGNEPHRRPGIGMGTVILSWLLCIFTFFHRLLLWIFSDQMPGPPPAAADAAEFDMEHQLKSRLSEKRYLIVIDDVRTEEVFNRISAFSWTNRVGGRIIVTTNIRPAERPCICGDDEDNSTTGLVFVGEVDTGMLYGRTCFQLCDAALARMQGLLGCNHQKAVLEEFLLYFSMFPHDHDVRRNPLIRRWLAEGLVVHAKQKVSEYVYRSDQDIVADHLDILINNNIIKSVKKSSNGKVKRCQPPGFVFNHICARAATDKFSTLLCGPIQNEIAGEAYVRRFSLHPFMDTANGGLNVPDAVDDHLHTMLVFPTAGARYGAILSFNNRRLLRVLDLKECADVTPDHLLIICDLLLLKYLSLGSSIDHVPRKIGKLIRLETLEMRTTDVVVVYSEVLKLPKLKHLLGKFRPSSVDCPPPNKKKETDDCPDEDPKKVWRLTGGFSKLKDFLRENSALETLAGIVIGNGIGLPQLLSCMLRLRKLKIWCTPNPNPNEPTDLSGIKKGIKVFIGHGTRMTTLDYSLSINFNGSSKSFLDALEDPGRLTSLKLSGKLSIPLSVVAKMASLQELCLSQTNLSGHLIQAGLSNLRCRLKFLKLVQKNLRDLSIQNQGPFVRLERICLVGMESLTEIIIQDLTKLDTLHLICPTPGALPGVQIGSLRNLKEVGLHSRVDGAIKRGWEAAARDHQRQPNVVTIETP
ncbi:hypothetical protein CFC21_004635 [Triticum aestivum]|uniref:NB-ARC domain-containing protein n=2 Tax=Triticum aestivum TaxID=4565 RepID=A0A9R1D807_WHEAT|nr:disease resistance protein RGA4-like isoform X1 [Triticum aestivum]KAF6986948.1 hypothetical protein CFC21_004635 [Triticum aestivum]